MYGGKYWGGNIFIGDLTFWAVLKNITSSAKTAMETFWVTFEKNWLLLIPTSGHTAHYGEVVSLNPQTIGFFLPWSRCISSDNVSIFCWQWSIDWLRVSYSCPFATAISWYMSSSRRSCSLERINFCNKNVFSKLEFTKQTEALVIGRYWSRGCAFESWFRIVVWKNVHIVFFQNCRPGVWNDWKFNAKIRSGCGPTIKQFCVFK